MIRLLPRISPQVVVLGAALAALAAGCSAPTAIEQPPKAEDPPEPIYWVAGYHPYWLTDRWATYDFSVVRKMMFFDVTVGSTGEITNRNGWPDTWEPLISKVKTEGGVVMPTISLFDTEAYIELFSNPDHVETLKSELLTLIDEQPIDGLHLDFEIFDAVPRDLRITFTTFVADLRREMDERERKLYLTLFTLAFDASDNFDEGRLARYADYLVVQGYDFHWLNDDEAGPVAPLEGWGSENWKVVVDRYLDEGVPRKKIVMSVPYYGYEWPTTSDLPGSPTRGAGRFTTYAPLPATTGERPPSAREQAKKHELRRDPASGSPYYAYQDSTGWVQGWFEDASSLRAKYEFVKAEKLGGVAVFPLGYGDETLHRELREAFENAEVASAQTK